MRVLVIPEDFRKDQYVLKPILTAMLSALDRPKAEIRVCQDPLLGGVSQALSGEKILQIVERYRGMVDLFILCVDRDGVKGRRQRLDQLEAEMRAHVAAGKALLGENAWQEVEVWALAGHDLPPAWQWKDIRLETNPKEKYFVPFAAKRSLLDEPGEGRRTLAEEAAGRYPRIRQLCPEDVGALENRIRVWIGGNS